MRIEVTYGFVTIVTSEPWHGLTNPKRNFEEGEYLAVAKDTAGIPRAWGIADTLTVAQDECLAQLADYRRERRDKASETFVIQVWHNDVPVAIFKAEPH